MVTVEIYTKDHCPYCIKAKMLLKKYKVEFKEIEIKTQNEMDDLVKKTSMLTVPQIFINNKLIGGCDDLYKLESEQKLKNMLGCK